MNQRSDDITGNLHVIFNLGAFHHPAQSPFIVKTRNTLYSPGKTIISDFDVSLVREQEKQSIFGAYVVNASLLKYLSILKGEIVQPIAPIHRFAQIKPSSFNY